ncbi:MAG TPA: dihydrolipoamide acetyltransferase family protein [Actinomycetota bacterium]|nr:dihydrolipoamide acetyltransferase family protein [Actinomycetota bacterium]
MAKVKKDFRLPDLGEGLEDAELVRWLVDLGDVVDLNQPIVEVDTAKALVEIPSPVAGTIVTLHAEAGEVVKVGASLVTFEIEVSSDAEAEQPALLVGYGAQESRAPARRRRLSGARGPGKSGQADVASPPESAAEAGPPDAAPPVRKLASELGVDLDAISGTGPGGRITREDVLAASDATAGERDVERVPVRGARRLIAQKMARSVHEIPHVTTYLSVDATEVLSLREQIIDSGVKVTPLAIVARAFVEVCKQNPLLNASFDAQAQEILLYRDCHLGIATDTERGLMVPVVRDAHALRIAALGVQIAELTTKAREGRSEPSELLGGTVTISNVGSFGAEYGTPIINYPESSILALGVIEARPVVRKGEVVVRPMATMSLSFDHRVLDGAQAGRALMDLKILLEDGKRLAELR